jgi:hypothetical protein
MEKQRWRGSEELDEASLAGEHGGDGDGDGDEGENEGEASWTTFHLAKGHDE